MERVYVVPSPDAVCRCSRPPINSVSRSASASERFGVVSELVTQTVAVHRVLRLCVGRPNA